MTRRHIHYEAAFEDYLRSRGLPYIAVDEHRKAIFAGAKIKSFDFLVYSPNGPTWLVDVKGRKFPYAGSGGKRFWENWVTLADLDGLVQWQTAFGDGFQAMLIFAYWLTEGDEKLPTTHVHTFRDQHYAFFCISPQEYRNQCRTRSTKWNTVSLPARIFKELAKPIQVLHGSP
ncbi:MAG: HYExAFE family protein [bacterium]|nr:HYExAFE family protein [bacterium]